MGTKVNFLEMEASLVQQRCMEVLKGEVALSVNLAQ